MGLRPRIGITMRLEMPTRRFYLGRDYCEAVAACGGLPLHIGLIPDREYIRLAVEGLDGILLPGSNTDIDPAFYGRDPHERLGTVIPEKDLTDRLVLEAAEEKGLSVLGICYGMQALNVWRGGSLFQDIRSEVSGSVKHDQGEPYTRLSHSISIADGSRLSKIASECVVPGDARVNSSHHQAVDRIGDGLTPTAWAPDGLVEAIEDTRDDLFIMGVQWHPEMTFGGDELSRRIFESFIANCSRDPVLN